METAVLVVWWIGLLGALVATLVILKEVFLVVGTLRDILYLAERTRHAARGLAHNLLSVERLGEVTPPAQQLHEAAARLAASATSVAQKLDAIVGTREA